MKDNNVQNSVNIEWLKEAVCRIELNQKDLSNEMKEGFRGVYARQDHTNGQVAENTSSIKWIWGAVVLLSAILGFVAKTIIENYLL